MDSLPSWLVFSGAMTSVRAPGKAAASLQRFGYFFAILALISLLSHQHIPSVQALDEMRRASNTASDVTPYICGDIDVSTVLIDLDYTVLVSECALLGQLNIVCNTPPCTIEFQAGGQFVIAGLHDITFSGFNFVSYGSLSTPAFLLMSGALLNLQSSPNISFSNQPLIYANANSHLVITDCPSISLGNAADNLVPAINIDSASVEIRTSVFTSCRRSSSLIYASSISSSVSMINSTWLNNQYFATDSAEGLLLSTLNSTVLISGCIFGYNNVIMNSLVEHPKLILARSNSFTMISSHFDKTQFFGPHGLGSAVALDQILDYEISQSSFINSNSSGCVYLHASESSGITRYTTFTYALLTGEPSFNTSQPTHYPPYEKPALAAAVCLTRNLEHLKSDFGVIFDQSALDSEIWNTHDFEAVQFYSNLMTTTSPHRYRRISTDPDHKYPLYAADIWGSNVRIHWSGDFFTDNTVRLDACRFNLSMANECFFDTLIEFGSSMVFPSSNNCTLRELGAYGSAPMLQASKYDVDNSPVSPVLFVSGDAIVTGGAFVNLDVTFLSSLTICCAFLEDRLLLTPPLFPFSNSLVFSNVRASGQLNLYRKTSPVSCQTMTIDSANVQALGRVADGQPAFIDGIVTASYTTFTIADLKIRDWTPMDGVTLKMLPMSDTESNMHGFFISSIGIHPAFITMESDYERWGGEWDLFLSPRIADISQEIPLIGVSSIQGSMVARIQTMNKYFPGIGTFRYTDGFDHRYQYQQVAAYQLQKLNADVYYHPSGYGVVAEARTHLPRFALARGNPFDQACFGIFSPITENCYWMNNNTSTFNSDLDSLSDISSNVLNITATETPATLLPQIQPIAFIRSVEPIIGTPFFTLDAKSSATFRLPRASHPLEWSVISWSCPNVSSGLLFDYLESNKNEWVLTINSAFLTPLQEYHFIANISNAKMPTRRAISTSVKVVVAPHGQSQATFCENPSFRIDASTTTYIYEHTRPFFNAKLDAYCKGFATTFSFEWQLATESGTLIHSPNNNKPWFQLPLLDISYPVGSRFNLSLKVANELGRKATSSINLVYKAYSPIVYASNRLRFLNYSDYEDPIEIQVEPSRGNIAHSFTSFECPRPAFDVIPQTPYSSQLKIPGWKNLLCTSYDGDQYDMPVNTAIPSFKRSENWYPGDHAYSIHSTIEREDGTVFSLRTRALASASMGSDNIVIRFYNGSSDLQYPYQRLHNSDSIALVALMRNGSLCQECSFTWRVRSPFSVASFSLPTARKRDQFSVTYDGSVIFLNSTALGIGSTVYVSVSYSMTPAAWGEARIEFEAGFHPVGGRLNLTGSGSSMIAHINTGSSVHPSTENILVASGCGRTKIVSYFSTSTETSLGVNQVPICDNATASRLILQVTDGLGVTSEYYSDNYSPDIDYSEILADGFLENLISSLQKSASIGDYEGIIHHFNLLEIATNVSEARWMSLKLPLIAALKGSLNIIKDGPFADLIASSGLSSASLLAKIGDDGLFEDLLRIGVSSPAPLKSILSDLRFLQSLEMIDNILSIWFSPDQSIIERRKAVRVVSSEMSLFRSLHASISRGVKPDLSQYLFGSIEMRGILLDIQNARDRRASLSYPEVTSYFESLDFDSIPPYVAALHTSTILFKNGSFPFQPTNRSLLHVDSVLLVQSSPPVNGTILVAFTTPWPVNASCAYMTGSSSMWNPNCYFGTVGGPEVFCICPFVDGYTAVTMLTQDAFCEGSPPSSGQFYCENGRDYISVGSVEVDSMTNILGPIVIEGNLTADVIIFQGFSGILNVTGCAKIGSVIVQLSVEEVEAILATGEPLSGTLLISSGCDVSKIPLSSIIPNNEGKCEKVVSSFSSTRSSIIAAFTVDRSQCKKSSSHWWIALVVVVSVAATLSLQLASGFWSSQKRGFGSTEVQKLTSTGITSTKT